MRCWQPRLRGTSVNTLLSLTSGEPLSPAHRPSHSQFRLERLRDQTADQRPPVTTIERTTATVYEHVAWFFCGHPAASTCIVDSFMMYQHCGSLLIGSLCNLHASGCLQHNAVPRPCRRPLRLRVHAGDDAPALASKPTLRAPPKKPAPPPKPQHVGFRTRLEREKQAAERNAADGQSRDQRSQGPPGNQQGGNDGKPSRDQQQREGGGGRPQPFQQRGPAPQNGSGPARPFTGDRPKWTPSRAGGNAGAPPGQGQGFDRRGSVGRGKSDWTQDGGRSAPARLYACMPCALPRRPLIDQTLQQHG